jgi:hypothetical protein
MAHERTEREQGGLRGKIIRDIERNRITFEISDDTSVLRIEGETHAFEHWIGGNPGMNLDRSVEKGILQVTGDRSLLEKINGRFVSLSLGMLE